MRPKLRTEYLTAVFSCIAEIKEAASAGFEEASAMYKADDCAGQPLPVREANALDYEVAELFRQIIDNAYHLAERVYKHEPLAPSAEQQGKKNNRILQFRDICKQRREAKQCKK